MFGITKGPHFSDNLPKANNGALVTSSFGTYLPTKVSNFFKRAGQVSRGLIAAEILNWADDHDLPNQFTFLKDVAGMSLDWGNKDNQYKAQFDRVFNTLGNKKLEWNDLLAFPLNLIVGPRISKSFDKAGEKKSGKSGNSNNDNPKPGNVNVLEGD